MKNRKNRIHAEIMRLYSERLCWPATARDDIFRKRVAEVLDDMLALSDTGGYNPPESTNEGVGNG